MNYEYILTIDGMGAVELLKVEESKLDAALLELEGKVFGVVTDSSFLFEDKMVLIAKEMKIEEGNND